MGRKKGPDLKKVQKIIGVLKENPQGLWAREIARRTSLSKSTVNRYLNEYMRDEIEEILRLEGGLVRIVRLKK